MSYQFSTKVIHAKQKPCGQTGAIMPPIYATSTYVQKSPGEHLGYEYSRTKNPTRQAFEDCLAELEEGHQAFAFASGMAAISAILELLPANSHIIASDDLYGGTHRLFTQLKNKTSLLELSQIDFDKSQDLSPYIQKNTKMLWLETPSNPMLKLVDIKKLCIEAKKHNLLVVVDNTFATPYLQQPLNLGADIIIHSSTKYLNGHSDIISGAVICKDEALSEKMAFIQNTCGAIAAPFDAYMILRSLKTLSVRMKQHCENAMELANWLKSQPWVDTIYYPGLENHQGHTIAKKQMKAFGGMISLKLKANLQTTSAFLSACKLFALAESLGGVESLIEHPAIMTHAAIPKENRQALGISDSFIRLSVGIEDIKDLKNDLLQASKHLVR